MTYLQQQVPMLNENLYQQLIESDNKDPLDYLMEATEGLKESIKQLKDIQTDHVYQVISNFILLSIMMFFMYLILSNIFNIMSLYYRNNTIFKNQDKTNIDYNNYDEEKYPLETMNMNDTILNTVNNSTSNQLKKLETIMKLKEDNNVDPGIHAQIDKLALTKEHDNYVYSKGNEKEQSFWDLLFEEPKYKNVVNSL